MSEVLLACSSGTSRVSRSVDSTSRVSRKADAVVDSSPLMPAAETVQQQFYDYVIRLHFEATCDKNDSQ